jgi:hypothetical protein
LFPIFANGVVDASGKFTAGVFDSQTKAFSVVLLASQYNLSGRSLYMDCSAWQLTCLNISRVVEPIAKYENGHKKT